MLTILHEKSDKPIDMPLVRERINVTSVKVRQLDPGYVYIRLSQFQEDTSTDLDKKLGDFIKKPISMQVETAYMQEQYDVILV